MIQKLTIGHLDRQALRERRAVALKPLDPERVIAVYRDFMDVTLTHRDGYLVVPWLGHPKAARAEEFAARLQAELGYLVADCRNGALVDLSERESW